MTTHDPMLTIDEAAELLGAGPSLPLRLVVENRLDHVNDGDDIRIPQSSLIAYAIAESGGSAPGEHANSATTTEHHAA
jgi:excisionase family DNA binding protein